MTKVFWEATPKDKRDFVADPAKGSRHNRGCAVDLTLYRLSDGRAVEMPSLYDEMTERAYPGWAGGTPESRGRRDLLRSAMEKEGFTVFESEWWHFDYRDWREYPILNVPFGRRPPEARRARRETPIASPQSARPPLVARPVLSGTAAAASQRPASVGSRAGPLLSRVGPVQR